MPSVNSASCSSCFWWGSKSGRGRLDNRPGCRPHQPGQHCGALSVRWNRGLDCLSGGGNWRIPLVIRAVYGLRRERHRLPRAGAHFGGSQADEHTGRYVCHLLCRGRRRHRVDPAGVITVLARPESHNAPLTVRFTVLAFYILAMLFVIRPALRRLMPAPGPLGRVGSGWL